VDKSEAQTDRNRCESSRCATVRGSYYHDDKETGQHNFRYQRRGHRVPAIFVGGWALEQLWLFWLAPLIGAALGGIIYTLIAEDKK